MPKKPATSACVTDSEGILSMARDAENNERTRQVNITRLEEEIDPSGTHILQLQMPHSHIAGEPSPVHWRTIWLVKLKGEGKPVQLCMDVSPSVFDNHTSRVVH